MKTLNNKQMKNIKELSKVSFTTASKNGQPRTIFVMPSKVLKNKIIISNIQMNKSIKNIKENPKCFINVYFPEKDDLQYKIEGTATVEDSGKLFKEIKTFEESENLPPELKVNSIIIVKIINVEESVG